MMAHPSTTDSEIYDAWFRAMVQEAMDDVRPAIAHNQIMDKAQALIDGKARLKGMATGKEP